MIYTLVDGSCFSISSSSLMELLVRIPPPQFVHAASSLLLIFVRDYWDIVNLSSCTYPQELDNILKVSTPSPIPNPHPRPVAPSLIGHSMERKEAAIVLIRPHCGCSGTLNQTSNFIIPGVDNGLSHHTAAAFCVRSPFLLLPLCRSPCRYPPWQPLCLPLRMVPSSSGSGAPPSGHCQVGYHYTHCKELCCQLSSV